MLNTIDRGVLMNTAAALCLVVVVLVYPDFVLAQNSSTQTTQIEATLCTVVELLTGPIGKAVAMLGVIMVGIMLFLGKVSWGLAITIAIGIACIFGADTIVQVLGGSSASESCSTTVGRS